MPDGIRPIFCKDCLSLAKKEKKQEMESRLEAKKQELASMSNKSRLEVRDNFSSAKDTPTVSLGQALKNGPVNFRGRRIESNRDDFKNKNSSETNDPEVEIKENEDIILDN